MFVVVVVLATAFPIELVSLCVWIGEAEWGRMQSSNAQVCRDVEIFVARVQGEKILCGGVKARKFDYEKCLAWKFLWLLNCLEALTVINMRRKLFWGLLNDFKSLQGTRGGRCAMMMMMQCLSDKLMP